MSYTIKYLQVQAPKQLNAPTNLNYNGHPLKANEVLVPVLEDDLFIKENVTSPDSIITLSLAAQSFQAVLEAVNKKDEAIAREQFDYWQNDVLEHSDHNSKEESIEDWQEKDIAQYGLSPSAADIAHEEFAKSCTLLIMVHTK